ncbi:MAG: type II toxin-antitoxin system RelE/ParE family toxin [Spirochaetota bacterium]|nr:MAG: type II toxin-antitoxin system RelE/ParE family toxin [Spirochaetota bacterium]
MAISPDDTIYKIKYTLAAYKMLDTIPLNHRRTIIKRVRQLEKMPEEQGKPLLYELEGFRSIRVIRYRVIYTVRHGEVIVYVVAAGIRKKGDRGDIYELAKKIIKRRFLD